jgi:hypothetical protein
MEIIGLTQLHFSQAGVAMQIQPEIFPLLSSRLMEPECHAISQCINLGSAHLKDRQMFNLLHPLVPSHSDR